MNQRNKLPTRLEVKEEDQWDLSPIYACEEDWEEDFKSLQVLYPKILEYKGHLGSGPEVLAKALCFERTVDLKLELLQEFCSLRVAEDSSNNQSLEREARLYALCTKIAELFAFFVPEIQEISEQQFHQYLTHPSLEEWSIPLKKLRRLKPHTLSSKEERLLALGSHALQGSEEIFSQLTNVDMKFGKMRNGKGQEIELTQSSYSSFLLEEEPSIRKEAFQRFYKVFEGHQFTLAASLIHSVSKDVYYAKARNYSSALEAALFSDRIPICVYENLIHTVRQNRDPLFRYFELRRSVLQLPEIHHYDTYVPLVRGLKQETSWDKAVGLVLKALEPLGDEYVSTLSYGLQEGRWCDRYENQGKRSGAFSSGSYQAPPYILMNYKSDVFSDIYTLAHEAGHSMHTWYASRSQSYQNYRYPIFLAEVASTFNEELLTHYFLQNTSDLHLRAYILCRQLDDIRSTLYRQTMFAEFEYKVHGLYEEGKGLTLGLLTEVYHGLLEDYFGPNFVLDEQLKLECLRIPHFYHAFYVYKYATGLSAAIALSQQVLCTKNTEAYFRFLKSGGSQFPIETLSQAGIVMDNPKVVEAACKLFADRLQELEQTLDSIKS